MKEKITLLKRQTGKAVEAEIYANNNGGSVTINGFKATLLQLQILSRRKRGMTPDAICGELGITMNNYGVRLRELRSANTDDFSDKTPPTVDELAKIADEYELIYPISVIGLETFTAEARKK
jgi:hypothetical protein